MYTTKVKALVGLLAVFLLGVITGALGGTIFIGHKIRQFGAGEHSVQNFFMQRLTRELQLTDAQKPAAEKINGEAEIEIHAFFQNSMTEFTNIVERRNTKLKTILTPEQQKRLDAFHERLKKRWPKLPAPSTAPPGMKP